MSGRPTVDPELCIGSGDCVRIAPGAFAIDESSGVSTPQPGVADTPIEILLRAAETCPMNAIEVRSADDAVLFGAAR